MKRLTMFFLVLFVITGISCKDRAGDDNTVMANGNVKGPYLGYSFDKGLALSKQTGRPMVIYFYTKWCGYCRAMDKQVFADGEVTEELQNKFVYVRIDTEGSEQLKFKNHSLRPVDFALMMGVQGFPTTVYLDKDLSMITKIPGFVNREMFLNLLSYIADGCYTKNVNFDGYDRKTSPCKGGGS